MNMIKLAKELGKGVKDLKAVVDKHHSANLSDEDVKKIRDFFASPVVEAPEAVEPIKEIPECIPKPVTERTALQILVFGE